MKNYEVAAIFKKMAKMLEIKGENPFRIRAYQRAAENIENLAEDIFAIAERKDLDAIPGIGKPLARKIAEILETGTLKKYDEIRNEIPDGLLEIITIQGVGPRTAKTLYEQLSVTSVDELERLAKDHKLQQIPGIRAKTEENILKGIALYRQKQARRPLDAMLRLSRAISGEIAKLSEAKRISVAGSLRRRRETIKDIDILVVSSKPETVMDLFTRLPHVAEVQSKGRTKASIRTREGIQVDLRVVEKNSFGAALCYFTGSKEHNVRLRELGAKQGLKINEYGVFRGEKKIGGKEEEDVFASVALPCIPPELREDRGEIEAAQQGALPLLVEMADIRGDLHVHSRYSDGVNSITEIGKKAESLGLEWIAVCDHSQSLKIAGGASIEMVEEKIREVEAFNRKSRSVRLLCGTEVDIANDGSLDYPDEILERIDIVIASIHSGFRQDEKTITNRILKAVQHPCVHIIGHPTGRLIGEREPYSVNLDAVIEEAARTGTALEINAYPQRLDLSDIYCRAAKENGAFLAIGTDAHLLDQMDYLELGVSVARRGWIEKKDLLNCFSYKELMVKIKQKQ